MQLVDRNAAGFFDQSMFPMPDCFERNGREQCVGQRHDYGENAGIN
jgi:hypothetical protein